ncbi:DUF2198 family protein [Fictibacillus sp. Mic-4]|uniref:DUF2198 family protein n=1 Tax=Fictibacillus sp. Mic-4 TaxID=3132826 RepID=UPI003CFAE5D6
MIFQVILAALLPIFFQLLFNRILFSKFVPLIITVLILLFAFDGIHRPLAIQIIAIVSTGIGFWLGLFIYRKQEKKVE